MGLIIKGKIYSEYVANIFTEKNKKQKKPKNLSEEKILRGKKPTEINIPGPVEH